MDKTVTGKIVDGFSFHLVLRVLSGDPIPIILISLCRYIDHLNVDCTKCERKRAFNASKRDRLIFRILDPS